MKRTLLASALAAGALLSSGAVAVAAEDDPTCDEARRSVAVLDTQVNDAVAADRAVENAEKLHEDLAKARAELAAAVAADNATVPPLTEDSQRTKDAKAAVAELEQKVSALQPLEALRKLADAADANQLIRLRVLAIDEANKVCSDVTTTPPTATPSPTTTVPLPPADDDDDQIERYPRVAPQTGGGPRGA